MVIIIEAPIIAKSIKEKLLDAINNVLKNNKFELTNKMEKVVKKSIKLIDKTAHKQIKKLK